MFNPYCPIMTHYPCFIGLEMTFLPIGIHANLILNRLRIERAKAEYNQADAEQRSDNHCKEQEARADLERMKERLAILRTRFK